MSTTFGYFQGQSKAYNNATDKLLKIRTQSYQEFYELYFKDESREEREKARELLERFVALVDNAFDDIMEERINNIRMYDDILEDMYIEASKNAEG